jgi:hypothetical protein
VAESPAGQGFIVDDYGFEGFRHGASLSISLLFFPAMRLPFVTYGR